jgi:hypothetical protein
MRTARTGDVAERPPFAKIVVVEGVIAASQLFAVWPESVGSAAPAQAGWVGGWVEEWTVRGTATSAVYQCWPFFPLTQCVPA